MKKHKGKNNKNDLKIIAARHKNEVVCQLKYYFDLWSEPGTYDLLPTKAKDELYQARFTPVRFEAATGFYLPNKLLEAFRHELDYLIDRKSLDIMHGKPPIPLKDFFTYYLTITAYVASLKSENFANISIIREKFQPLFLQQESVYEKGSHELGIFLDFVAAEFSEPGTMYYTILLEPYMGMAEGKGNYLAARISTVQPVTENFDLPEGKRPAFKVGLPFHPFRKQGVPAPVGEVHWLRIRPPSTGAVQWQSELEIFIQSHALHRMYERLDLMDTRSLLLDFFFSFVLSKPIIENGSLLFPFKIIRETAGYFKGDIIGNKILLRTFLFLTNEGTPESKKLKEHAGLSKTDISYLKIDTLRNFVHSDIIHHASLRELFEESGCGGLFRLKFDDLGAYNNTVRVADTLIHYLGMEGSQGEAQLLSS